MEVDRTDLAVFGFLLVSAFAAYAFYANPFAIVSATPTPSATTGPTVTPQATAVISEVLAPCMNSPEPDACAGSTAYRASQLSSCSTWPQPDACRYFYYTQKADEKKEMLSVDEGLADCLSLNNTAVRAACLQQYAILTKSPEYCQALEYGRFRQACIDEVSNA